ncbi:MAG: radical SAM protein [Lachnospiraceae bacterium]|nr:radical SAM protein [Lachnospiraceae bacterium]
MNECPVITNIQRMCFHDGPGIRTTVFLKGCSIHCPWCSNPENISFDFEEYTLDGKSGVYGRKYSTDELYDVINKDCRFWGKNGGVTFSGGEALMQIKKLEKLLARLHNDGVNLAVESAMFVPSEYVDLALKYIDYFIIDIKILESELCKRVLGGDIELYFSNVKRVYNSAKQMLFRIPCNYEYTLIEGNKDKIKSFLLSYPNVKTQIFAIHDLGESKYRSLDKSMWKHSEIDKIDINNFYNELINIGLEAEIIHI